MKEHPIIGRAVRFDGKYRGLEGIVLDASFGHVLTLVLEVTTHVGMPDELDGARPIRFIEFSPMHDGLILLKPEPTGIDGKALQKLVIAYFDASRAWNLAKRQSHPHDPNPARDDARLTLDKAFRALQMALGEGNIFR